MSRDGEMDWSASPTSWAAVFEGDDEGLPIPERTQRSLPNANISSSTASYDQKNANSSWLDLSGPDPIGRRCPSALITTLDSVLETIVEAIDEAEAGPVANGEVSGDQSTEMPRSLS